MCSSSDTISFYNTTTTTTTTTAATIATTTIDNDNDNDNYFNAINDQDICNFTNDRIDYQ